MKRRAFYLVNLFNDLAIYFTGTTGGVRFVGIDMHSRGEFIAYANNYVAENKRPAVCIDLRADDLFIFYAEFFCGFGIEVYVAFSGNNAFGNIDFTGRADKFNSVCAFYISRFTDLCGNT